MLNTKSKKQNLPLSIPAGSYLNEKKNFLNLNQI